MTSKSTQTYIKKYKRTNQRWISGISYVPFLVGFGLVIAGAAFFTAFITTQKASMPHKYQNLLLPVPTPPARKNIPPLLKSLVVPPAAVESPSPASPEATMPSFEVTNEATPTFQPTL